MDRPKLDDLLDVLLGSMTITDTWSWLQQPVSNLGFYHYQEDISVIEFWDYYKYLRQNIYEQACIACKIRKELS